MLSRFIVDMCCKQSRGKKHCFCTTSCSEGLNIIRTCLRIFCPPNILWEYFGVLTERSLIGSEWQRVTASDSGWQRVTAGDNGWHRYAETIHDAIMWRFEWKPATRSSHWFSTVTTARHNVNENTQYVSEWSANSSLKNTNVSHSPRVVAH